MCRSDDETVTANLSRTHTADVNKEVRTHEPDSTCATLCEQSFRYWKQQYSYLICLC